MTKKRKSRKKPLKVIKGKPVVFKLKRLAKDSYADAQAKKGVLDEILQNVTVKKQSLTSELLDAAPEYYELIGARLAQVNEIIHKLNIMRAKL